MRSSRRRSGESSPAAASSTAASTSRSEEPSGGSTSASAKRQNRPSSAMNSAASTASGVSAQRAVREMSMFFGFSSAVAAAVARRPMVSRKRATPDIAAAVLAAVKNSSPANPVIFLDVPARSLSPPRSPLALSQLWSDDGPL
eukprot:scaffold4870_cov106-Isochrysis_galbana.AAC.2